VYRSQQAARLGAELDGAQLIGTHVGSGLADIRLRSPDA
jgi:hypothetical protein